MPVMSRTYAAEFECYLPDGVTAQDAAAAIRERGVDCRVEDYNHQTRTWWKIVTDRSLGDMTRGREFVPPILRGEDGFQQIETVTGALNDLNCSLGRKCGMHVHVGLVSSRYEPPPIPLMRNLLMLYNHFEPVIDKLMPKPRRGRSPEYCYSNYRATPDTITRASDLDSLIKTYYQGDPRASRNHKLNYDSWGRHRTVEFRHHSGTLEYHKVRNWIMFCLRMVDAAEHGRGIPRLVSRPAPVPVSTPVVQAPTAPVYEVTARTRRQVPTARRGSRSRIIADMAMRPEGVSYAEGRAAANWRQFSGPPLLTDCGLAFYTRTFGRTIRFYAPEMVPIGTRPGLMPEPMPTTTTTTVQPPPVAAPSIIMPPTLEVVDAPPVTLETLMDILQCTDIERAYFRKRTRDLGGAAEWTA